MTTEPKTRLRVWLRERRRQGVPSTRKVYPAKNVVSSSAWQLARAHQRLDVATDELAIAAARLSAMDAELAEFVTAIVRQEISKRRARRDDTRTNRRKQRTTR